jgi:thiol-disulfide isomerase/thioredoxin
MKISLPVLVLIVAVISATVGFMAYRALAMGDAEVSDAEQATKVEAPTLLGQRRPDYRLGSTDGAFVSASDFDGSVVLVNFWATWCAPCREEMPMLMELREKHQASGFEVVGVALDDVQNARDFLAELGVAYPNLVGSTDVMVTLQQYGNTSGVLPYTVLVGADGTIRWTRLGVLDRVALEQEIEELLSEI